jgi:hypothetical protein
MPARSAFAVFRGPGGLIPPGPGDLFQPLTPMGFEFPSPRRGGRWWCAELQAPGRSCFPRHRGDVGSSPAAPAPVGVGPVPALRRVLPARPPRDRRSDRSCGGVAFRPVVPSRRLRRSVPFRPSGSSRRRSDPTRADPVRWSCPCIPVRPSADVLPPPPVVPTGMDPCGPVAPPVVPPLGGPPGHGYRLGPTLPWPSLAVVPPKCSGDLLDPAGVGLPAPRTRCNL